MPCDIFYSQSLLFRMRVLYCTPLDNALAFVRLRCTYDYISPPLQACAKPQAGVEAILHLYVPDIPSFVSRVPGTGTDCGLLYRFSSTARQVLSNCASSRSPPATEEEEAYYIQSLRRNEQRQTH